MLSMSLKMIRLSLFFFKLEELEKEGCYQLKKSSKLFKKRKRKSSIILEKRGCVSGAEASARACGWWTAEGARAKCSRRLINRPVYRLINDSVTVEVDRQSVYHPL